MSEGTFTFVLLSAFALAFGAIVFLTAYFGRARVISREDWSAKALLMTGSYAAWMGLAHLVFLRGVESYVLPLVLIPTALTSVAFLIGWVIAPKLVGKANG